MEAGIPGSERETTFRAMVRHVAQQAAANSTDSQDCDNATQADETRIHSPLEMGTPMEARKVPSFPGLPGAHLVKGGRLPPSMLQHNGDFNLLRLTARNWTPGMFIYPDPAPGRLMESCVTKVALGSAMGGVMGILMGVFIGAMNTNTHMHGQMILPGQTDPMKKGWKREMRDSFRQTGFKSKSWAKNFAYMTAIYSSIECAIEKARGRHDLYNSVSAGCLTGAALAAKTGDPKTMGLGCAGFAAFSVVIDMIMGH